MRVATCAASSRIATISRPRPTPTSFINHLRRVGVGEGGVTRGEVALVHAALRGRRVLAAVLHVDHGPACEKKARKCENETRYVRVR